MKRKSSPEVRDGIWRVIEVVNGLDVFWLRDLRAKLGVEGTTYSDHGNSDMTAALKMLKKGDFIQCCGLKGAERQYIVVKKAKLEDLFAI